MSIQRGIVRGPLRGLKRGLNGDTSSGDPVAYTRGVSESVTAGEAVGRSFGKVLGLSESATLGNSITSVGAPPLDGPSSAIYVPQNAADFTFLGLTAPNSLWLMQESSGNLSDSIGSLTLTANGTPLYQQSVTNWTRKGIGFNGGTNQRMAAASGTGPSPASTSTLWLGYCVFTGGSPAAGKGFMFGGATPFLQQTSTDRIRITGPGSNTADDATTLPGADATVHPIAMLYDRTNSRISVYTNEAKTAATYNSGATDGQKGFGGMGAVTASATFSVVWGAMWSGSAAEMSDANVKSLLQGLGWTIPW